MLDSYKWLRQIFQYVHVKGTNKMWTTRCTVNIAYIGAYSTQYYSACLYPTLMFTIMNV